MWNNALNSVNLLLVTDLVRLRISLEQDHIKSNAANDSSRCPQKYHDLSVFIVLINFLQLLKDKTF